MTITVCQRCREPATYSVSGAHDGFPNFELYINEEPVTRFDAVANNQGPFSLFPPEEWDYADEGDGVVDRTGLSANPRGSQDAVLPQASSSWMQPRQSTLRSVEDVCATVKLQLEQDLILTRLAVEAQLEITNSSDSSITNLGFQLVVYDEAGDIVSDRFQLREPELSEISGVLW